MAGSGNVEEAWKFLRGKGLSPAQAAGVIGSMQGESGKGLDPTATNPGPDHAYGIAQWLGGRKSALMSKSNPASLHTQLQHLWSELQGPEKGAFSKIKGAHTIEDASHAWQQYFERGAPFEQKYDQRAANAREVFNQLKGVGGGPSTPEQALMGGSDQPQAQAQGSSEGLNAGVAALLAAGQKPVIQSAGIATPAFSARPATPAGYAPVQGGGGPVAQGPNVDSLLALVAGQGQGGAPTAPAATPAGQAPQGAAGAGTGEVKITGPNPHRVDAVVPFLRKVSGVLGEPLVGSDGSGHSYLTVNGNVSEHSTGHAVDLPASGQKLIRMGQAALIAAGMPAEQARKQTGGLFNVTSPNGVRHQIIFNTQEGGDHTDHLHASAAKRRGR